MWHAFAPEGTVTMLQAEMCDRARMARDARFDGRFFTGVRTTGVYCRPICPVKPAHSAHVCFFPSAAAAERHGFRPCLRCRPETAAGTPAWQGSATTISRGLTLINAGFLDEHSVEELATVLGMGARHLTRLFMKHLGAPPSALARTRRVQIAKQLLGETSLAITEIAFAAGFASIRRFNTVFKDTYGQPPSHFRCHGHEQSRSGGTVTLQLAYRPPFSWPLLAGLLADEATPGVESVRESEYCRTMAIGQAAGWFSVRPILDRNLLCLVVQSPDYASLKHIMERVRTMFDLNANPGQIGRHLEGHPRLASLARQAPGLRLLGAWDGFEVAVRGLVACDVGRDCTVTVMRKLAATYGQPFSSSGAPHVTTLFPAATSLMQASMASLGLSRTTENRINTLAKAVVCGHIRFDPLITFDELVSGLTRIANFDLPAAHWVAMRTLGEPDANPFGAPSLPTALVPQWLDTTAQETLRPWRSYAAMLLATSRSKEPIDAHSS